MALAHQHLLKATQLYKAASQLMADAIDQLDTAKAQTAAEILQQGNSEIRAATTALQ